MRVTQLLAPIPYRSDNAFNVLVLQDKSNPLTTRLLNSPTRKPPAGCWFSKLRKDARSPSFSRSPSTTDGRPFVTRWVLGTSSSRWASFYFKTSEIYIDRQRRVPYASIIQTYLALYLQMKHLVQPTTSGSGVGKRSLFAYW